ncbi:hypothetical protein HOK68_03970 [Candidatus Woesearchaeota archaeon]|jgi:hypothetical protein|nr:hypothetical protein [Candidatus Woesearchaeota archaeon]MBT4387022.1 hypothetical protein [Candidatus Woesearchaeota archaeon]MBT4595928.1 hypothetical protein [Candidatus Woesearchaeota archaeon]MBT5741058.1 hypothetical protein [Candidatus Woesearchaeota archaeon]MBT6505906.1 hypothetical protein [Candidatus Woesearchaeota archaeon]
MKKIEKLYFKNFLEEKMFRKITGQHINPYDPEGKDQLAFGSQIWGQLNENYLDSDIRGLIKTINELDFLYTKGMSCSGSIKDHFGFTSGFLEKPLDCGEYINALNEYGIDKSGFQGYIMLRADTNNPKFLKFEKGLKLFRKTELNQSSLEDDDNKIQMQEGIKNLALQVWVPKEIYNNSLHLQYRTYMSDIWMKIHNFTKTFL